MERTKLTGRVTGEPLQLNNRKLAVFNLQHDEGITTVSVHGMLATHCQTDFQPGNKIEVYGQMKDRDFEASRVVIHPPGFRGTSPQTTTYRPDKTA